jgi:hypothetical protein
MFYLNLQGHTQTCCFIRNRLFPKENKEERESIEEIIANSLTLITSKTRLISCKQEGKHFFYHLYTCDGVNEYFQGLLSSHYNILFFSAGKCLQEIQRPSTHLECPKRRNQRLWKGLHRELQERLVFP